VKARLLYFAAVREVVGIAHEQVDLPDEITTVADVRLWLASRGGAWFTALGGSLPIRAALNQRLVPGETVLPVSSAPAPDQEVMVELAFFPPVTGG